MSSALLKIGAVIITTAAFSASVYYVHHKLTYYPLIKLSNLHSFNDEDNYPNKFGYIFAPYFLSAEKTHNLPRWEEKLKLYRSLKNSLTTDSWFAQVSRSKKPLGAIRAICKSKYKQNFSDSDFAKWKEVWKFCSVGKEGIFTLEDLDSSYLEKKNIETDNWKDKAGCLFKSKLLSVLSGKNDWFWDIREEEFKLRKLTIDKKTDVFFDNKKVWLYSNKLRKICSLAYEAEKEDNGTTSGKEGKTEVNNNKIKESEILKFCSVSLLNTSSK